MTSFSHWHIHEDEHQILWAELDKKDASVNTINDEILDELEILCNKITHGNYTGFVISSGKSKGFIAGADIEHFSSFKDSASLTNSLTDFSFSSVRFIGVS